MIAQLLSIRPYTDAMRLDPKARWEREWDSRAGGVRCVKFRWQVDHWRILHLQLWGDGRHRVSMEWRGRQATPPTDFQSVTQMHSAIAYEKTRVPPPAVDADAGVREAMARAPPRTYP